MASEAQFDKARFSFKTEFLDAKDQVSRFVRGAYLNDKNTVEFYVLQGYSPNLQNQNGDTPVMAAACAGNIGLLKYLLQHGGDPDFKNNDGITALMYAVANGRNEAVRLLVGAGADKSIATKDGMTAEEIARLLGNMEVLGMLKDEI
ncbi:MAG: ankyrin repeat domain-containing protein [Candidatus Micrarchaeota archaeon]|nr:ankyrin repeat domain-containing protein [Candidatus Micrarchaeota archaeon]